jgi:serine/threonine protein kinase
VHALVAGDAEAAAAYRDVQDFEDKPENTYVLGRLLGEGTFGQVYMATHRGFQKMGASMQFVVKVAKSTWTMADLNEVRVLVKASALRAVR